MMTKKLLLMATIVATSCLFLDNNEAQAQGWRNYNQGSSQRGINTRVYGNAANRGFVNPRGSQGFQTFVPYHNYSSQMRSYSQYGYPSIYGYGSQFSNNQVYRYPTGYGFGNNFNYGNHYGFGNNYGYGSNYGPYGFQQGTGIRVGSGTSGLGNSVWRFVY